MNTASAPTMSSGRIAQNHQGCGSARSNDKTATPTSHTQVRKHRPRQVCSSSTAVLFVRSLMPYSKLPASVRFFSSVMFMPRPFNSLHSTSNATGMPASNLFVPLTMLS